MLTIDRTQVMGDLKANLSRPFDFRLRDALGKSPVLHPKIKVFAIDDTTVAWLGAPDLTVLQWTTLIRNMANKRPAAIIIDKMFSIANIPREEEAATRQALLALQDIDIPIYIGSYIANGKLKHRVALNLESANLLFRNLGNEVSQREDQFYTLPSGASEFVYGAAPSLRGAFKNFGHLMYNGDNHIAPVYRVGAEGILPYIMLKPFFDQGLSLTNSGFKISQGEIPTTRDGRVLVNIAPYSYYHNHAQLHPLRKNIKAAHVGQEASDIEPDDYVYIVPFYFTGNTDFKQTALGIMPAAYIHLAFLNSVLSNQWLIPMNSAEVLLLILACLIGGSLARFLGTTAFGFGIFGCVASWLVVAICLFSYASIVTPWLLPLLGFVGTALTVFVDKSRIAEKKSQFIHNCLDGMISAEQVNLIARRPEILSFSPREQVVSVMFIDVVGFSLIAENQLPRIAFDQLKMILGEITQIVHDHGGIVNKNLGDGLLCFFGYSLELNRANPDHASQAMGCAIAIQKRNLPRTLTEFEQGLPVFPLRIGINTASVYLGNIGTDERIDLTIVGNGVNFAKRLEGACANHTIMLGPTTKELIDQDIRYQSGLLKRYIEIKHHIEMIEAWEFDPFHDALEMKQQAIEAHKRSIAQMREDERWELPSDSPISLSTNVGVGKVLNYSRKGLSIWIEIDIMVGTLLQVKLNDSSGQLAQTLAKSGNEVLVTEVCWCLPYQGGWSYGLKYKELGDTQLSNLLLALRAIASKSDENDQVKEVI